MELAALPLSGGTGTATQALARVLMDAGFIVKILFTNQRYNPEEAEEKKAMLLDVYGLDVDFLDARPYSRWAPHYLRRSKAVYEYFMTSPTLYDVVLFHEYEHDGYFCLKCKDAMECFDGTSLGVICHGSLQWKNEANGFPLNQDNAILAELERICVSLADFVLSPSQYLVDWMRSKGWFLPSTVFVIPYVNQPDGGWKSGYCPPSRIIKFPRDIIIFGGLETHKGVEIFIESLKKVHISFLSDLIISFVVVGTKDAIFKLNNQLHDLKLPVKEIRIIRNNNCIQVKKYIQEQDRLVIIPSLLDNSPSVVYECLKERIPFICSDTGGQVELISPEDHEECLFEPRVRSLCNKIEEIVRKQQCVIPSPSQALINSLTDIQECFRSVISSPKKVLRNYSSSSSPLITIVIPTYNRLDLLKHCINSVLNQSYRNIEIIIIDDGSDDNRINHFFSELLNKTNNIRIIRQGNLGPGAARNEGVRHANGDYLVFLDDDDLLHSDYVFTCIKIALRTGVKCIIPAIQRFNHNDTIDFWLSAGGGTPGGWMVTTLLENYLGHTCMFIDRNTCLKYPFPESTTGGWEDWSLLLDIHLSNITILPYPRPLVLYRISIESHNSRYQNFFNYRVLAQTLERHKKFDLALLTEIFQYGSNTHQLNEVEILKQKLLCESSENCELKRFLSFIFEIPFIGLLFIKIKNSFCSYTLKKHIGIISHSGFFDGSWYLDHYPDVAQSGMEPACHYAMYGWIEGRDPGPDFSTKVFLENKPLGYSIGINPLVHYESHYKKNNSLRIYLGSNFESVTSKPNSEKEIKIENASHDIEKYTLSIIITIEKDCLFAFRTLHSINASRIYSDKRGLNTELIIVIPSIEGKVHEIINEHPVMRENDQVLNIQDNSSSALRNKGVAAAHGEFICVCSDNCLLSESFFVKSIELAIKAENTVVYSKFIMDIETQTLFSNSCGNDPDLYQYDLFLHNSLKGPLTGKREIFELHKYPEYDICVEYEEWILNIQLLSDGYYPVFADTIFFSFEPYMDGFTKIPDYFAPEIKKSEIMPFYPIIKQKVDNHDKDLKMRQFPCSDQLLRMVHQECLKISQINPQLHPSRLNTINCVNIEINPKPGFIFSLLRSNYKCRYFDFIYILPWIVKGGADLEAVNLINLIVRRKKKALVIITSGNRDNSWLDRLDPDVHVLIISKYLTGLSPNEQELVLSQFILMLSPPRLHLINSELGFEVFSKYGELLSTKMQLFVSIFCNDFLTDGTEVGYVPTYLHKICPYVKKFFADSIFYPKYLHKKFGVPYHQFHTVYNEIILDEKVQIVNPKVRNKVLWAGRLDRQKRPDILLSIAKKMPDIIFEVYGSSLLDSMPCVIEEIRKQKNISFHGNYDGFNTLQIKDCFCYLYTSEWDGLPNVILEATARGLPIVAPDVGGVSELINNESGWLIQKLEDFDEYVKSIYQIRDNPILSELRWKNAITTLRDRHSSQKFNDSIWNGYI